MIYNITPYKYSLTQKHHSRYRRIGKAYTETGSLIEIYLFNA